MSKFEFACNLFGYETIINNHISNNMIDNMFEDWKFSLKSFNDWKKKHVFY